MRKGKKIKKERIEAKIALGYFSERFLVNPKKKVDTLALQIPANFDKEVNTFLTACWKKKESLILRSVFSASGKTQLVFMRRKDQKNIKELELKLENFYRDFIPDAEK